MWDLKRFSWFIKKERMKNLMPKVFFPLALVKVYWKWERTRKKNSYLTNCAFNFNRSFDLLLCIWFEQRTWKKEESSIINSSNSHERVQLFKCSIRFIPYLQISQLPFFFNYGKCVCNYKHDENMFYVAWFV